MQKLKQVSMGVDPSFFSPSRASSDGPAGLLVDYQWTGPLLLLATVLWFRSGGHCRAGGVVGAAFLAVCLFNGNAWALLALPLLGLFGQSGVDVPRWRWTFLG